MKLCDLIYICGCLRKLRCDIKITIIYRSLNLHLLMQSCRKQIIRNTMDQRSISASKLDALCGQSLNTCLKEIQFSSFQVHKDNSKVSANFSCVFKLKAVKHPQIYSSSENVTLVTIVPFYKVLVACFSQRKKKKPIYTITKKLVKTEIFN